jgi:tetratricopeptide (TPR) repeat protein
MTRPRRQRATVIWAACGVLGGASAVVCAQGTQRQIDLLNQAIQQYDDASQIARKDPQQAEKLYLEAAEKFQSLVNAGIRNAGLYYNLGNTHLRLGNIGLAILNYRRAQRLDVSDSQLNDNLKFARSLRRTQIEEAGRSKLAQFAFYWHYNTNSRSRLLVAGLVYVAFWVLMLLGVLMPRPHWHYAAWSCGILWAALVISVSADYYDRTHVHEGVVISDDVIVRKGNGDGFEPQFVEPLHQGVEFTLIETRGSWHHVRLPDGKQGWLPANVAAMI